jgi:hypothetical protein
MNARLAFGCPVRRAAWEPPAGFRDERALQELGQFAAGKEVMVEVDPRRAGSARGHALSEALN